jgi:endonuclease/exonuclease/phosphatase family metal-dependent hydrolase
MSDEFKHKIRLLIENFYYSNLIKNKKLKNVYSDWCRNNDNFSIMSFNLKTDKHDDGEFSWMYRKNLCSNVIKMYCPDIISFQEVNPHMHKFMVSELYEVYNHYSADRKNGKELHKTNRIYSSGLSIFYNKDKYELIDSGVYWLSDTPDKPSATWGHDEYRMVIFVMLKDIKSEKYFYVYNTHFDHTGINSRLKSSEFLVNLIKDNIHESFICGDFNAHYDDMEMKPLNETFDNNVIDKTPTFTGFHFNGKKIIDMIYSSKKGCYQNKVITTSYRGYCISDHCPVMITKK